MRKFFYWSGWIVLALLPILYGIEIYITQDLPPIATWQWFIPFGAIVLIYVSRNHDDVLRHHLV
jgi:hypothetical protein